MVKNNAPSIHKTHQKRRSVIRIETVEARERRREMEKQEAREEEKKQKEEEEKKAKEVENAVAAPPSATANPIEDLDHTLYPEGVTSPKPELNVYSKKGKFRWARL
jgi:hypothetical protein